MYRFYLLFVVMVVALGLSSAQEPGATVQVVEHPSLGEILVGPTGMTLYVLSKETASDLQCLEDCARNWLPLTGNPVANGLTEALSMVRRTTDAGSLEQLVYKNQPLYYWSRDKAPGDVTGEGIGGIWSVARP